MFFILLFLLFTVNLYIEFSNYKKFIKNEIYFTEATIINIYHNNNKNFKAKSEEITFFTSNYKNIELEIGQKIDIYILTKNINFISYLKGFYAQNIDISKYSSSISNKIKLSNYINEQHNNKDIASLYNALFIATPLTSKVREISSKLGISHLIAISGFHLGVISFVLYFILHFVYNKIHQTVFPYRNKKFDLMIVISILLLSYLIFIDLPASLLRAFTMYIFALFLLRSNIKIISFETLLIVVIFIIVLFPKLLFSLSLWFSIAGVFYIFLFIKYLNGLNKLLQLIIFNFWIYLIINPITHYFFATTSLEQLYSPLLTLMFSVFYPISIILHFFNVGGIFDIYLENIFTTNINSLEVLTTHWFFICYLLVSVLSVIKKEVFILLNIIMIIYNIWLFHFVF